MIATIFIDQQFPVRKVLQFSGISASTYYYCETNDSNNKRGIKPSEYTLMFNGSKVPDCEVVKQIKELLQQEFVDYGYLKVTYFLQDESGYHINHKKVFRLMQVHKLLYQSKTQRVGTKKWVTKLVPEPTTAFSYWEFDIKFMYIHGTGKMVPLLSIIDVYSRWVLGHLFQESIKKEDVKVFFEYIIQIYRCPQKVYIRCDNGSQFESTLVRDYFLSVEIEQEFTKPATPEQNAHIESYHSVLERGICRRYEFEGKEDCFDTLNRWLIFYNYERIHSGTDYKSPYKNLSQQGFEIDKIFFCKNQKQGNIFIGLNQTETSSAEEQLVRDSSAEGNKGHPNKIFS
jgi:transposase InsO family protein